MKLSKLAYNGIYSDSESEEFSQQLNPDNEEKPKKEKTPRERLIEKLEEKGIDVTAYATEKGLNKDTTAERFEELLKELGE